MTAVTMRMTDGQFAGAGRLRVQRWQRELPSLHAVERRSTRANWIASKGSSTDGVLADGKPWPGLVTRRQREVAVLFYRCG